MSEQPLYPFGYGLSYTTYSYADLEVDKTVFGPDDVVTARVSVTNTGSRPGQEIVQWYVRDLVGSTTRPEKELKGFSKISLAPGERKTVTFQCTARDLAFYTADNQYAAEPGTFWLMVGPNSAELMKQEIRLTE